MCPIPTALARSTLEPAQITATRAGAGHSFGHRFAVWLQAVRPFSLPLSIVPVLLGTLLALYEGQFSTWLFLLTLLGTVAIHTGANLANNYYDYARGLDSNDSFGPARLISQGRVSAQATRNATLLAFAIGAVAGLVIVAQVGWTILAIGLISVAVAYFYSAGPRPMAYAGLGELLVFTFLGIVILEGSYYVQTLQLSQGGFWLGATLGLWATCVLVLNDIRDQERDRSAGKLTLAVLAGRRWSEREFAALAFGSYGLVIAGVSVGVLHPLALTVLLTLPWAIKVVCAVRSGAEGWALTKLQGATAIHYLAFSALLAIGITADRLA